jgi:AcrR family transcriptional regulator
MARKTGDRNRDFDKKREQLLDSLQLRLLHEDAPRITMNEMAIVAGVSLSSLRHHFGSRSGLYAALLQRYGLIGKRFLEQITAPPQKPLRESLAELLRLILTGLRHGVLDIHAVGLAVGMRDRVVGPAYLHAILEPTLQSVETRLALHVQRGELRPCDLRIAALSLISPLLLAAIHQHGLCGQDVRPLSLDALCDDLLVHFLRAYGPDV